MGNTTADRIVQCVLHSKESIFTVENSITRLTGEEDIYQFRSSTSRCIDVVRHWARADKSRGCFFRSRLTFLHICRRALSGRHASLQIIGICLSHVVLPSPHKALHSTICTPHMINLLAKTRQSLDVLIGK
jgi:hypothetical protein